MAVDWIIEYLQKKMTQDNLVLKGSTVEPLYNEDLGSMKITLLYQVSCYIRVKKHQQRNI